MEVSEVNEITVQFVYDSMYVETGVSFAFDETRVRDASLLDKYGLHYTGSKGAAPNDTSFDPDEYDDEEYESESGTGFENL